MLSLKAARFSGSADPVTEKAVSTYLVSGVTTFTKALEAWKVAEVSKTMSSSTSISNN
jgi:hypothetical protein